MYMEYLDWVAAGNTPLPAPSVQPTHAQIIQSIQDGVQFWLDTTAQSKGYDSSISCISYINSSNTKFQAEANSMLHWRDAVWSECYNLQAQWTANIPDPLPTPASVMALLPKPEDFGWST